MPGSFHDLVQLRQKKTIEVQSTALINHYNYKHPQPEGFPRRWGFLVELLQYHITISTTTASTTTTTTTTTTAAITTALLLFLLLSSQVYFNHLTKQMGHGLNVSCELSRHYYHVYCCSDIG